MDPIWDSKQRLMQRNILLSAVWQGADSFMSIFWADPKPFKINPL